MKLTHKTIKTMLIIYWLVTPNIGWEEACLDMRPYGADWLIMQHMGRSEAPLSRDLGEEIPGGTTENNLPLDVYDTSGGDLLMEELKSSTALNLSPISVTPTG